MPEVAAAARQPIFIVHGIDEPTYWNYEADQDGKYWRPTVEAWRSWGLKNPIYFAEYYECDKISTRAEDSSLGVDHNEYATLDYWPMRIGEYGIGGGYFARHSGAHAAPFFDTHIGIKCGNERNPGHEWQTPIEHVAYHLAWAMYENTGKGKSCAKVVAHSMGGLISRYAIAATEAKETGFPPYLCVTDLITYNTPHLGGRHTEGCVKGKQCEQLKPDSAFLRKLNTDYERLPRTQLTAVGSAWDMAVEAESGIGDGLRFDHKLLYLPRAYKESAGAHLDLFMRRPIHWNDTRALDHGSPMERAHIHLRQEYVLAFWDAVDGRWHTTAGPGVSRCDIIRPPIGNTIETCWKWFDQADGWAPARLAFAALQSNYWGCGTRQHPFPLLGGATVSGFPVPRGDCYYALDVPTSATSLSVKLENNDDPEGRSSRRVATLNVVAGAHHANLPCTEISGHGVVSCAPSPAARVPGISSQQWVVRVHNDGDSHDPFRITVGYTEQNDCGSGTEAGTPDASRGPVRLAAPVSSCAAQVAPSFGDAEDWFVVRSPLAPVRLQVDVAGAFDDHGGWIPQALSSEVCLYHETDLQKPIVECSSKRHGESHSVVAFAREGGDYYVKVKPLSHREGRSYPYTLRIDAQAGNQRPVLEEFACEPAALRPGDLLWCSMRATDADSDGVAYYVYWDYWTVERIPDSGFYTAGETVELSHLYPEAYDNITLYPYVIARDNGEVHEWSDFEWAGPISISSHANRPPSIWDFECPRHPVETGETFTCIVTATDDGPQYTFYLDPGDGQGRWHTRWIPSGSWDYAYHGYTAPGDYATTVWAYDGNETDPGYSPSATRFIRVVEANARPTTPSVTCEERSVDGGVSVSCALGTSDDSDGIYYVIDWGDGNIERFPAAGFTAPGASAPVSHGYAGRAVWNVTVWATDDHVGIPKGSVAGHAAVGATACPECDDADAQPPELTAHCMLSGVAGARTNCTLHAPDAPGSSFYFTVDWGDGVVERHPSSGTVPAAARIVAEHVYARAGQYPLGLRVTDDNATRPLGSPVGFRDAMPIEYPEGATAFALGEPPLVAKPSCSPSPTRQGEAVTCRLAASRTTSRVFFTLDWGDGSPAQRHPATGDLAPGEVHSVAHTYTADGVRTLRVTATETKAQPQTSEEATTTHLVLRPSDLSVRSIETPRLHPLAGEPVQLDLVLGNEGSVASENVSLRAVATGGHVLTEVNVGRLEPGETPSIPLRWTSAAGVAEVHLEVSPGPGEYDIAPDNNSRAIVLTTLAPDQLLASAGATLPAPVTGAAATWASDATFLFGGCCDASTGAASTAILRYDGNSLPALVQSLPAPLADASAVWTGREAIILGNSHDNGTASVLSYDPVANRVAEIGRLPTPRWAAPAVWTGDAAFLFGGEASAGSLLSEILRIGANGSVEQVGWLPEGLAGSAAIWDGTHAYVFGGRTSAGRTDGILRFDPATGSVDLAGRLPAPRSDFAAAWNGQSAYLIGGATDGDAQNIVKWHPRLGAASTQRYLREPTTLAAVVIDPLHRIFAFGGSTANGSTDEILRYSPPIATLPAEPTNLSASSEGLFAAINITWSAASTDAASAPWSYRVYVSKVPGEDGFPVPAPARYHLDGRLPNDAERYYRVSAVNEAGEGPLSTQVHARAAPGPGTQPPETRVSLTAPQRITERTPITFRDFSAGSPEPAAASPTLRSMEAAATPVLLHRAWDFGDGTGGVGGETVTRTFPPGSHNVSLTVWDENGASATYTRTISVERHDSAIPFEGASTRTMSPRLPDDACCASTAPGDNSTLVFLANGSVLRLADDTLTDTGHTLPPPGANATAVAVGASVYIFTDHGEAQILRYNGSGGGSIGVGSAHLRGAAAVAVNESTAFLFGGCASEPGPCGPEGRSDRIWRFDAATASLVALESRLPTPLAGSAAFWDGHHVYVLGGETPDGASNRTWRFYPKSGHIEELGARLPRATAFAQVAWTGRYAYVMGGSAGSLVSRFDPSEVSASPSSVGIPAPRSSASAVWNGTAIVLVGGGSDALDAWTPPAADGPTPVADFIAASTRVLSGEPLRFTDLSSDGDGYLVDWSWNFGDGATSAVQSPVHAFNASRDRNFTVTLDVTDDAGLHASRNLTIEVEALDPDMVIATLAASPAAPVAGEPVHLTATVRNAGGGAAAATTLSFLLNDTTVGAVPVAGLEPGETVTLEVAAGPLAAGVHSLRANLATSDIPESNETNNDAETALRVARGYRIRGDVLLQGAPLEALRVTLESADGGILHAASYGEGETPTPVGGFVVGEGSNGTAGVASFRVDVAPGSYRLRADSHSWTGELNVTTRSRSGDGEYHEQRVNDLSLAWVDPMQVVGTLPSGRGDATAVSTGTHVYLFGGDGSGGGSENADILRFDPETGGVERVAQLPSARTGIAGVWTGLEFYLFGGYGQRETWNHTLRYDPATGNISRLADLPRPIEDASAFWDGRYAYVLGGSGSHGWQDAILRFDPVANSYQEVARLPTGRAHVAAVWTGDEALLIGGSHQGGGTVDQVLRFDPESRVVTIANATLPSARTELAGAWDGRHAYVLGGHDGDLVSGIVRYDPATGEIVRMNETLPSARMDATAAWIDGHVYVFGGREGGSVLVNQVVRYAARRDLPLATDSIGPSAVRSISSDLPEPWSSMAQAPAGNELYLFGGQRGTSDFQDRIFRFNGTREELELMPSRLPTPRAGVAAAWSGDHIYLFGGEDRQSTGLRDVVRYTPATGEVRVMNATLPAGRRDAAAFWDGRYAYVLGGLGWTDEILRYDPASDTIELVARLPTARAQAPGVWTGKEFVLFGGSQNGGGAHGQIVRFDPQTRVVTIANATLPAPLTHASAAWDGEHAYVLGGYATSSVVSILRYDPLSGELRAMNATLPSARSRSAAGWIGSAAYVFGGHETASVYLNQIVRYDPRLDRALPLGPLPNASMQHLNVTLAEPWEAIGQAPAGDDIYLLGGRRGFDVFQDRIFRFNTTRGELELLPARLPTPRSGVAAAWTGDALLIFGGVDKSQTALRDVLRLDPSTGELRTMNATLPTGREASAAFWDGRNAYVVGGSASNEILRYDPASDAFTLAARLPVGRWQAPGVWTGDEFLLFGGAATGGSATNAITRFDPSTAVVSTSNATLPVALVGPAALWDGQHAYVLGGYASEAKTIVYRYDPVKDGVSTMTGRLPFASHSAAGAWGSGHGYVFGGRGSTDHLRDIVRYAPSLDSAAPQPDLVVTALELTRESPAAGDVVRLRGTVRNDGLAPAGPFSVRFSVNGTSLGETVLEGLAAGASIDALSANWTVTEGIHTMRIVADATRAIAEDGEGNNEGTLAVTIVPPPAPLPDLSVAALTWAPQAPVEGDALEFQVTVSNSGAMDASAFHVRLVHDGRTSEQSLTGLAAGASSVLTFTGVAGAPGNYAVTASVDVHGAINESDETTNDLARTLIVGLPPADPADWFLPLVAHAPWNATDFAGIGVRRNATAAFDAPLDELEPAAPALDEWIQLYAYHPLAETQLQRLNVSHLPSNGSASWTVRVAARGPGGQATLTWDSTALDRLARDRVALLTTPTGVVNMREASSAKVLLPAGNATADLVVSVGVLGDVNGDGLVTGVDSLFISQFAVGNRPASDLFLPLADVNRDGRVSGIDAMFVAQHVVGNRPQL